MHLQIHAWFKLLKHVKPKNFMSKIAVWTGSGAGSRFHFHQSGPSQKAFLKTSTTTGSRGSTSNAGDEHDSSAQYDFGNTAIPLRTLQCLFKHEAYRTCNTGSNRLIRHQLCQRTVGYNIKCELKTPTKNRILKKNTQTFLIELWWLDR